jgi:hypothetical protein
VSECGHSLRINRFGVPMENLESSRWILLGASVFFAGSVAAACAGGESGADGEAGGVATGATAGTATAGGNTTTSGGNTSTSGGNLSSGGINSSGGSGGGAQMGCDGNTPVCSAVAEDNGCSTTVLDFEDTTSISMAAAWATVPGIDLPSGLAGGTYAYGDGGTLDVTLETADGANDSAKSFHFSQTSAVQWGGGFGFWFYCTDVSAYTGLSFWLKGTLPAAALATENPGIQIAFSNPDTTPTEGCGNCEANCMPNYAYVEITEGWALYSFAWGDLELGSADSATPNHEFDPAGLHGINFHIPAAVGEDIDVSIDEFELTGGVPTESCDAGSGGSGTGSGGGSSSSSGGAGGSAN